MNHFHINSSCNTAYEFIINIKVPAERQNSLFINIGPINLPDIRCSLVPNQMNTTKSGVFV